jgi:hypothetical protein
MPTPGPVRKWLLILALLSVAAALGLRAYWLQAAHFVARQPTRTLRQPIPNGVRVLFLGNSLTYCNSLPSLLQQMTAREPRPLDCDSVLVGGWTLMDHWNAGYASEKILGERWDFVVLQELSTGPLDDAENFFKYARLFGDQIKKAGAEPLLFMTWSRRDRPRSGTLVPDAYTRLGREINVRVAPVGLAWQKSLKRKPALKLYQPDGVHPNPVGSYVAACVFYSMFYNKSPRGVTHALHVDDLNQDLELSDADAAFLQGIVESMTSIQQPATTPSPEHRK